MGWKIGWGISNRCNMACKFCYSRKVRKEQANFKNNIGAGIEFVAQNAQHIESINFGTGEPTVEPEFFECCAQLKRVAPHVSIGLTTNGHLAECLEDPVNYAVFKDCIDDIDVSLDYAYADKQNESRNHPGAFQGVIDTLKLCQRHNKNTTVVSVLHKYNCDLDNVISMMRIARIFGASFRINILRPTVDFEFALPYEELKKVFSYIIRTYEVESVADPLMAALIGVECPAGDPTARSSFRILPNGYVTPSTYLLDSDWQSLRIDEIKSLSEIEQHDCFMRIKEVRLPKACEPCPLKDSCCGGVIDRRWLWYHDLNERDPYCPLRFGDALDWSIYSGTAVISSNRKSFVHDGYLPTLIFNPSVNERATKRWDDIYIKNGDQYTSSLPEPAICSSEKLFTKTPSNILDLGSGTGRNGRYLVSKGHYVTFVDSSYVANDILLENLLAQGYYSGYEIIETDVAEYLNRPNLPQYDVVIATHILSHGTVSEIQNRYIKKIHDLLSSGGILIATLPSTSDIRCPDHEASQISMPLHEGPEANIMHSFFDKNGALQMMTDFEILGVTELHTNGNTHWVITAMKKTNGDT